MEEGSSAQIYPALQKDDSGLLDEILRVLTNRVAGDPYNRSGDCSFGAGLANLPAGLRAMAATHWLDVSLTLDSITWHFGNFGEASLVEETETGLHELGLDELASCFREAKEFMIPLLANRTEADGDPYNILDQKGLRLVSDELDSRAWALGDLGRGRSVIYEAWTRYTRQHPERVFGD